MQKIKLKFVLKPEIEKWVSDYFLNIISKHFEIVISDSPDYVITGSEDFRQVKYDCTRIVMIGENQRPDFNICDYAIGFDHIKFEDRYIRFPLYFLYDDTLNKALNKHLSNSFEITNEKTKFCNFIVSNGNADNIRELFFDELSKYKKVDSGGRYRNNIGGPVNDKLEFQNKYKFSICFENSSTSGYLTEKIFQAFAAKTIPIYWGDSNISKSINNGGSGINPKSFINLHEFPTFEDAINHIKLIDQDPNLFLNFLSEPVFIDENHIHIYKTKFEKFLLDIFSQDPQKAFRRGFGQFRLGIEERYKRSLYPNINMDLLSFFKKRILR
jgi:hypothetical protein